MTKNSCKIVFVCTEDWFFHSHFLPLARAAAALPNSVATLVTTTGQHQVALEAKGIEVRSMDFDRASLSVMSAVKLLWRLIRILRCEAPDIVHYIALKPVLFGGLAALMVRRAGMIYHVTGLGTLAEGTSLGKQILKAFIFRLVAAYLRRRRSQLIVENPDDKQFLLRFGLSENTPVTILGGAGVDPNHFQPQPVREDGTVSAAFVGRMIWTKGVDVLISAIDRLRDNDHRVRFDFYGERDPKNPGSYSQEMLDRWASRSDVKWHGHVADVRQVWEQADICIVPTRTREGMPRAMLEAAACARPLIVTDIPGCRHFVRDGVEGFVVPPDNPVALAAAIAKMAENVEYAARNGGCCPSTRN